MGLTVILTRFDPNFVIDNVLVLIDWKALVPKFILSFGNTLKKNRPGWCYKCFWGIANGNPAGI